MGAEPVTPKGVKTRERILEASRAVFARDGYVSMRMGDVAVEAGLSMGSLYRYFKNKEDLFAHLIADVHEMLYQASGGSAYDFATEPFEALLEANRGYLECYYANRDIMRTLFEAVTVDKRDREIWWRMRERHIERFTHAIKESHGITHVDGVEVRVLVDSMASLVEQSAYCWYAQEELNSNPIPVDIAARTVTIIWYRAIFT
ncbi:TetR family transcriptional regulator [Seongchinamella sediminis]|uniref:TetR family transcriptional regulator n=1 Tax=Seongchinamella sediminis TaxID=2283635 RepID=A0A3L7DVX9_9GAMM|nr:TetR/AcrR family transcriptional regulator [Seongchinamella sediminis]RLQ21464.1 TetR family transcriptional regulator [Seongchinamella sediminis]